MTRDEILNMQAGDELDLLVCQKLNLFTNQPKEGYRYDKEGTRLYYKKYSTDITAAWDVVEKMLEYEKHVSGHDQLIITRTDDCKKWYVEFNKPNWEYAESEAFPLAICRAALLAVMEANE